MTKDNTQTQRTVLIIDGNSWLHRAFHAISTPLMSPDGRPTNAVFGFLSILVKTIHEIKPDAVVAAFDAGRPAFRTEALEQYKMQRPPTDPTLKAQFPLIEGILESMNIPVVKAKGWEGDDILGTLSREAEEKGYRVYLASGDRDIFQLITERTSVINSNKGVNDIVVMTPEGVEERYGVIPEQVTDFLGLKGDTSDNIPGVAGVGEKTATKLLNEHGSLDAVLEAAKAGFIKGKVGQNLVEHAENARTSRIVATIARDVPIEIELDDVAFGSWDIKRMTDAFMELRLRNPLAKLLECGSGEGCLDADIDEQTLDEVLTPEIRDASPFRGLVLIQKVENLFDNAVYAALAQKGAETEADILTAEGDEAFTFVAHALEHDYVAVEDLKALNAIMYPPDTSEPARLNREKLASARIFDVSLAAYLLESNRKDFSLEALSSDYLAVSFQDDERDDDFTHARKRAVRLTEVAAVLFDALKKENCLEVLDTIEMPLALVLADVEREGVAINADYLGELSAQGRAVLDGLQKEIYDLAGKEFNIDSPRQLGEILFVDLGLPGGKKNKTGYSTNAAVLEKLRTAHPIIEKIMQYREYNKLQSTYIDALPRLRGGDGRIHTTFNQTVAATGRLSSSNPNLQNIPVRTELGRQIREAFIPSYEGWSLLSVDYSQIELRVLAHLSQDQGLIEAFASGADFHTATAARVFGVDSADVDSTLRSRAKAVNFGIVYGQGAHGLGESLGIPRKEAQEIIDRYYAAYPRVKEYLNETVEFAKEHGWVETAFHRKRHIPELKSPAFNVRAFGERTAMNHPMQGTAADLIKLAMIAVAQRLKDDQCEARMLLQVHDELVFEVPQHEIESLSVMVSGVMSSVVLFDVPLEVSVVFGPTWADAK